MGRSSEQPSNTQGPLSRCQQAGVPYLPLYLLPGESVRGPVRAVLGVLGSILLQDWQQVLRRGVVVQP